MLIRAMPSMPAMHNHPNKTLHKLCVCRALNEYVRHTGNFRQEGTSQHFVAYRQMVKGKPISKKRLYCWLVECIKYVYDKNDLPVPEGVKSHQTCKMAVMYADMAGDDSRTICMAASWQSTCTFAKYYRLDAIVNSDAEFGRRVLTLAGSSTPAPYNWGGYRIPQKQHVYH